MQIAITPEIETILTEYAGSQNISPEMLVQNVLKEWFGSRTKEQKQADVLLKEGYQATRQESLRLAKEFEAADAENWDDY